MIKHHDLESKENIDAQIQQKLDEQQKDHAQKLQQANTQISELKTQLNQSTKAKEDVSIRLHCTYIFYKEVSNQKKINAQIQQKLDKQQEDYTQKLQ